jgi:hypothetical protein
MYRRATLLCRWERAGVGGSFPEVKTVHSFVFAVGLGSGRRRGNRGDKDGAALRDFSGALRHDPPHEFLRHPGVAKGRPHVRLSKTEGLCLTANFQSKPVCACGVWI